MEREGLAQGIVDRGCTRRHVNDRYYPSRLLRCDCNDHALAAVACGLKGDEPVKLFGAALSWYVSTGRKSALTFVLGKHAEDVADHWKDCLHAIQMLVPNDLEVDLQVEFKPAPDICDVDLSSASWVNAMLDVAFPPSAGGDAAGLRKDHRAVARLLGVQLIEDAQAEA